MKKIIHLIQQKNLRKPVTQQDIILFFRQLTMLLSAAIPLIRAFEILEKSQEKIALHFLIYSIKNELLSGKNLHFCFRKYPTYFGNLICQLIELGEQTGKLPQILLRVTTYLEKNQLVKKQLKHALFYPTIILCTAFSITLAMLLFVVPRFAELFADMHANLPLLTRFIFAFSRLIKQNFHWVLAGILLILILSSLKKFYYFKKKFLMALQKFPLIHLYHKKITLARFARNLALTQAAQLPLLQALQLMTNMEHTEFNLSLRQLERKVSAGSAIHHAMQLSPYFPKQMVELIKIGEECAMLETLLDKIAEIFEEEIAHLLHHLLKILEPLIMLLLGVLIGALVIGMYLPIFNLGTAM